MSGGGGEVSSPCIGQGQDSSQPPRDSRMQPTCWIIQGSGCPSTVAMTAMRSLSV